MCFMSRQPKVPEPEKAPLRADATKRAVRKAQTDAGKQKGIFGNIFTSALGDVGYGTSTSTSKVAALGSTEEQAA